MGAASKLPVIHVVSDSVGLTAQAVARAAASQFGEDEPAVDLVPNVRSFEAARAHLDAVCAQAEPGEKVLVFYTLVEQSIRESLLDYLAMHPQVVGVDLISDAIGAIAQVTGEDPQASPGGMRAVNSRYFHRIEALEFTIEHDDGRNPQDLTKADIVLLGVSRSSKTPTSIYLAQEGYRVANVPLDLQTEPPHQIYDVDPTRLFGLMTTPEVLVGVRRRRLGNAAAVAKDYADPEQVACDLDEARALMRKLGCIVVHTDNRAVEETAQEILRYYDLAHPRA